MNDIKTLGKGLEVSFTNKLYLPYDSAVPLKDSGSRKMKIYIHKYL